MELDDLKKGWEKRTTEQSKTNIKNMEQLEIMLKQKTSGLLNNVKKNYGSLISHVLVAIMFTLVLSGFAPWLMGQEGPVYRWPTTPDRALNMLVIAGLVLTFIFFYWIKYTAMETAFIGTDIKQTLQKSIEKLRNSLIHEVLYVTALFFGWVTIARFHSQVAGYGEFWDILHIDILLAIGSLAILLIVYLVVRYRQYRKFIHELREYLEEYDKA
jgi:hypothetical protein